MKPSSHAVAMLIAAYRKILNHDFLLKSQDMVIPQGKTLLSCLAVPLAVGALSMSGSAYAYVPVNTKISVNGIEVNENNATTEFKAGDSTTAAKYTPTGHRGNVAGNYNGTGNTTNLTLTVNSGFTVGNAYGAYFNTTGTDTEDYTLTITGGGPVINAYGGYSDSGSANYNTLNIEGGTIRDLAGGGYVASGTGSANYNTVNISGGTIWGYIFGGASGVGSANYNTVNITDGTLNAMVLGGYVESGSGSASNNKVFIAGGDFGYGVKIAGGVSEGGTATGNAVYLNYSNASTPETDTLDLSSSTVYGGMVGGSGVDTSNSIFASGIVKVNSISGFNALTLNVSSVNLMDNFSGDSSEGAEKAVIISTSDVDLSSKTLTLTSTDSSLSGNYALIYSSGSTGVTEASTVTVNGTFTSATYTVSKTSDSKLLYVNAGGGSSDDPVTPSSSTYTKEAETLSAAHLSSAAVAVSMNSFSATEGMASAVTAASTTTNGSGIATFGAVGGGSLTYKVGSHIDVDSFNATVGGAKLFDNINEGDALTVAAFIDMGIGHSRSHVINTSASSDNKVFGIGTGIKYQFACGAFADATARIGRAKAEFKGAYSRTGLQTEYDSKTTYYGFSLGGGYNFDITEELTLSPYARYTFTRNGSDTVSLKGISNKLHLDAVNAHSVRTGLDGLYKFTDTFALKAGLAVEHTWDGDAKSQLGGVNLATPSISGTSGIMDLGVRFTPSGAPGWDFEIGATGRVGDVHGVTGQIKALYVF